MLIISTYAYDPSTDLKSGTIVYGTGYAGIVTGIENINFIPTSVNEAEYYNLQGIRVHNPANGIYIRKVGIKTDKVVFK